MMRKLLTSLLIGWCVAAMAGTSTIPDMKFRRLDTRDGLSNSQVNYIFQDSKGFVWMGTSYGLNRYDGYRFRTFYSDPNDTTTLRNNYVDWIYETASGKLILKQGMNYSVYDPVTETFDRNPQYELAKIGITGGIDRIHVDSEKNLWVKTYTDGIYCYNPKTKKLSLTKYGYEDGQYRGEYYVSSFADNNGTLLIATSNGELIGIDGKVGKVLWVDDHMRRNGGRPNEGYALYVDKQGSYYVMSSGQTFVYYQKNKTWYNSFADYLRARGFSEVPENLQVWDLMWDEHDWLWVATDHDGLVVFDMKNKDYRQFLNNKFDPTSLSENTLRHLCLDKFGNMWIGSYRNGMNQYVGTLSGLNTLELGDINAIAEDADGNYWLGSNDKGIVRYNPITGERTDFTAATSGFASDIMVAAMHAHDGSLWFGTYNGGLIQYKDGHFRNYLVTNSGLANNNVWSLTEDKWGNVWMGTLGSGIQKLNPKTGEFQIWNTQNGKLSSDYMTNVSWIKKGWLMAGSSDFYSLINPVSGKTANIKILAIPGKPAAMGSTAYVIEDSRGLIWHGSTAGCCIVDGKTGSQTMLDMNSGLFGSSVVGIVEDQLHTMWVVTEHGVSNVIPKLEENGEWTFLVRSFSSKDGLQQGPYNQRSVCMAHNGLILVGGLNGVDVINPKLITNVSNNERPVFSGLKLFGQQMGVGEEYEGRVILKQALDVSDELVLRYDENQFTIQLATDKGETHNPSRFVYMLEGFSDKWIKTEEADPNITYMSLKHGSYILHVRMLNDDGTMGKYESVLKISITPPLWRTRWMMLLYILAVVAVALLWRRRFLKRHAELVELEKKRQEVEKKHWMSEMKKQMSAESTSQVFVAGEHGLQETTQTVQFERTNVVQLFREVCDEFKLPENKSVRLSFFPFVDVLEVMANKAQLKEMLQILLTNAVTFSPSSSKVKVFVEREQDKAVLRVADSGVGIPDEVKPHLFEEIIGDDDSPNLHKVFDIVEAHHGTVNAEENHGGGSLFIIKLPCAADVEVEDAVLLDENE